ncbi:MAG: hypothetical protein JWN23_964 [Rhodocyclales bacterium]|nr:hypothetical protein [Rhodocyclales bacterium]
MNENLRDDQTASAAKETDAPTTKAIVAAITPGLPLVRLAAFATFLGSIGTGASYVMGVAYWQNYLSKFALPEELFAKTTSDYFLCAYTAIIESLPKWLSFAGKDFRPLAIVALGAILFMLIVELFQWLERKSALRAPEAKTRSPLVSFIGRLSLYPALAITAIYFLPLYIVFLAVLPAAVGEYAGKSVAEREMNVFKAGCGAAPQKGRTCYRLLGEGKVIAHGFVVAIGASDIAVMSDGRPVIVPADKVTFDADSAVM